MRAIQPAVARARLRSVLPVVLLGAALGIPGCVRIPFLHHKPEPPPPPPVAAVLPPDSEPAPDTTATDTTKSQHPLGLPASKPARTEKKDNGREEAKETGPAQVNPPTQVESVMSPADARQARERTVSDTVAVVQALKKCSGRQLLPDQESVYESVRSLLAQTRGALQSGELWRAESLARKARQLASSLNCP